MSCRGLLTNDLLSAGGPVVAPIKLPANSPEPLKSRCSTAWQRREPAQSSSLAQEPSPPRRFESDQVRYENVDRSGGNSAGAPRCRRICGGDYGSERGVSGLDQSDCDQCVNGRLEHDYSLDNHAVDYDIVHEGVYHFLLRVDD